VDDIQLSNECEENGQMARDNALGGPRLPYDGLFGDSNLIRVIRQVIADPFTEYRPIDLQMLTQNRAPTIRESLKILTALGLLIKDESDRQHPKYRVNIESKKYVALTFLAYAILDDRNGTDCLDDVIADYYDSVLRAKYEPLEITAPYVSIEPSVGIEAYHIERSELVGPLYMTYPAQGSTPLGGTITEPNASVS
jgi:hypothetical protein